MLQRMQQTLPVTRGQVVGIMVMLTWFMGCGDRTIVEQIDPDSESDCASSSAFTEEEVRAIVEQYKNGDESSLTNFSDDELENFVDSLQLHGISILDIEDGGEAEAGSVPAASGLAACSGYWGIYATGETIEQRNSSSGLLYEEGPNCMMWAGDTDGDGNGDCGEDYDDYMLSFYFGHHDESPGTLKGMLKWTSSSSIVRLLLGNLSARLYEQTESDGADNYNVYACVDDGFGGYLETFKMRKY